MEILYTFRKRKTNRSNVIFYDKSCLSKQKEAKQNKKTNKQTNKKKKELYFSTFFKSINQ